MFQNKLRMQRMIKVHSISIKHIRCDSFRISDSQIKAATSKLLDRRRNLVDDLWFESCLSFSLHLLSSLLLVIFTLHVLKFTSQSFDFVFVLIDLSLVHVEFSCHGFHLACLFFQVLLINRELFSNLRSRLSSKQVFEFNVEILFFLDQGIPFNNLFGLLDETFLKS